MTTFFQRNEKEEKKMEFVTSLSRSLLPLVLIESVRRKSSLFSNARRKLARVNSNTLQIRSVHARTYAMQGFERTYSSSFIRRKEYEIQQAYIHT